MPHVPRVRARAAGVGLTNGLIGLRQLADPTFMPPNEAQNVLATSAAYGLYMSVSSNLRYQVIAGAGRRTRARDAGVAVWRVLFVCCAPRSALVGCVPVIVLRVAVRTRVHARPRAGVVEERGIEMLFAGKPQLCHALSLVVRTANTFLGSLLWVDFVRLLGMQTAKGH